VFTTLEAARNFLFEGCASLWWHQRLEGTPQIWKCLGERLLPETQILSRVKGRNTTEIRDFWLKVKTQASNLSGLGTRVVPPASKRFERVKLTELVQDSFCPGTCYFRCHAATATKILWEHQAKCTQECLLETNPGARSTSYRYQIANGAIVGPFSGYSYSSDFYTTAQVLDLFTFGAPLTSPDPELQLNSGPWYGVPGHRYCYPTKEAAEAEITENFTIVTFGTLREFLAWENEHSVSLPLTGERDDLSKMYFRTGAICREALERQERLEVPQM